MFIFTLQFLHFHTKLASPLLPDCSFCSCATTSALRSQPLSRSCHTKRLNVIQFGWVSRHDVHCTLNVYSKGLSSVSSGTRSVTLFAYQRGAHLQEDGDMYPSSSADMVRASILVEMLLVLHQCCVASEMFEAAITGLGGL